ncbi:fimbria/pilus outer membrane usher protein [Trinickia sp. YCB016]
MTATNTALRSPRTLAVPVRPLSAVIATLLMTGFAAGAGASPLAVEASVPAANDAPSSGMPGSQDAASSAILSADDDATFNPTFLSGQRDRAVDLSRFERGGQVQPGVYRADVYVNGNWLAREDVTLRAPGEGQSAAPCFTRAMLERYGVDMGKLPPASVDKLTDPNACVRIEDLLADATASFDPSDLRLTVSVPQADMSRHARGYVDPKFWDRGVNAAFVNYNTNVYRSDSSGFASTQGFLGLNAGVNVMGWLLRSNSSLSWQDSADGSGRVRWQAVATYAQRDLERLRARVTLGEIYTSGDVFDSIGFRGAQIATDDRMLPESLRGYAPTVRGVAQTNAKVTVRQSGNIIYETTVSPGPFVLNDLYSTGYGGDLDVTVTEADGRQTKFSVPYASVTQLLRPGVMRYAVTAGQLRDVNLVGNAPYFAQGVLQRGVTDNVTLYGGLIGSQGYGAVQVGGALNTRFGAVSADVTTSQTAVPGNASMRGQSVRIGYSKLLEETNTNFTVAAYRYSSSGYLSLSDAATVRDTARSGGDPNGVWRARNRFVLSANQPLGENGGNLYVTASAQNYWGGGASDTQYQLGYTNRWRAVSYNLSVSRLRNAGDGRQYTQFYAGVSIPLGRSNSTATVSASLTRDTRGNMQEQTNLNGSAGELSQFNYSVYANGAQNSGASANTSGGVNVQYRAPYTQLQAAASVGTGYRQISMGAMGSVVAHPGGITLGQSLGETIAIVEAPDAKGASLTNAPGLRINGAGYAVVPYLTPYSLNTVEIDPKGSSMDVELKETTQQIAPHAGAVVMLRYKTVGGRTMLVRATLPDGEPLPFGADVLDAAGNSVGAVGQGGQIYARVATDTGSLAVQWGSRPGERCSFKYMLPVTAKPNRLPARISATCEPDFSASARRGKSNPSTQQSATRASGATVAALGGLK